MSDQPNISVYRDGDCTFTINRETNVMSVVGNPLHARIPILKLIRQGWLHEDDIRAIWFKGNPTTLYVGINLTIYLTTSPEQPKPKPRTFKEMINADIPTTR